MVFLQAVDGAWRTLLGNPGCFGKIIIILGGELGWLATPIHALLLVELTAAAAFATGDVGFSLTAGADRRWCIIVSTGIGVREWLTVTTRADLLAVLAVGTVDLA
ncbi:MAG: hypothetical protein EBS30_18520 [Planctomycetes bacterium]|nr:hypothetical protein [Planctomycetota bacterium]